MGKAVSGINPKILVWARRMSGHTVEDVGRALGKDPQVIASWERGDASPTYVQLETLAYRVYKRPVALFFFPEPPPEPDPEHEFRTLPDAEIRDLAADTRYKIREARAAQVSLGELAGRASQSERRIMRDLGGSTIADVPAAAVRKYLGVSLRDQKSFRTQEEALKRWRSGGLSGRHWRDISKTAS